MAIPHPGPSLIPCQQHLVSPMWGKDSKKLPHIQQTLPQNDGSGQVPAGKTAPHLGEGTCWSGLANYSLVFSNILSRDHHTPQYLTEMGPGLHFGKSQKAWGGEILSVFIVFQKSKSSSRETGYPSKSWMLRTLITQTSLVTFLNTHSS